MKAQDKTYMTPDPRVASALAVRHRRWGKRVQVVQVGEKLYLVKIKGKTYLPA